MIAVCKGSNVVFACGFEWENDDDQGSQNQWESLRIAINTVIFRNLCHLALDHWRLKTFLFLCDLQISLKSFL